MKIALLTAMLSVTWASCQTMEPKPTPTTQETFPETPAIPEDTLTMEVSHGFRIIHLTDSISAEHINPIIRVLGDHHGIKGFIIEIDNTGGDVDLGFALAKAIERARIPVHCVVDGNAQSMAYFILQSCTTRSMTRRSFLMIHNPALKFGEGTRMNSRDTSEYTDKLVALQNAMIEQYIRKMKMTKREMQDKLAIHNWYLGWEEALKMGAVDHVYFSVDEALTMAIFEGK